MIVPSFMIARNVYGDETVTLTGSPTLLVVDGNEMSTVGLSAPGSRWHATYRCSDTAPPHETPWVGLVRVHPGYSLTTAQRAP